MSNKEIRVQPIIDAVEKAGGIKLPNIKTLSSSERFKVSFSIWAALFSIFYYLWHGMWKKGLTLLVVYWVIYVIAAFFLPAEHLSLVNIVGMVIFATRAPVNLYSHYKLKDTSWNPLR
ncbi:MAG: DUF2628 domain-containing protein [Parvibaculales bacterium]